MPLSLRIDPEQLVRQAEKDEADSVLQKARMGRELLPVYQLSHAGRYMMEPVPKYELPERGVSERIAYEIVKDELLLDGKPNLNLASFVNTWMPEEAGKLMHETIGINLCDQDEYPGTMSIHARCITIISDLWKAPRVDSRSDKELASLGTATTGSSEAIMLGLLAAKRRWQQKRRAEGKDIHKPGPNLVFGANAQVAIEKFARYWDVEERPVDVDETTNYCMCPKRAMEKVDENTIAVVTILGSTYTGHYEPVEEMAKLLDEYEAKTGHSVQIHVDGASGAMVAPFATPSLRWSFDIPRVQSINTSGHKFGLVYPGLGWILFRTADMVPEDLIFELHYLGSVEYSFGLNFSRPAAPVLAQMFNFINLGREGYSAAMYSNLRNARVLSRALEFSGLFHVVSDCHRPNPSRPVHVTDESNPEYYYPSLPVCAFRFSDQVQKKYPHLEQRWLQTLLRTKGWIVPNYELPPTVSNMQILRVVVRDSMTESMVDSLVHDIIAVARTLMDPTSSPNKSIVHDPAAGSPEEHHSHARHHRRHNDAAHARPHGKGRRGRGFSSSC